jgi:hypothetical protein
MSPRNPAKNTCSEVPPNRRAETKMLVSATTRTSFLVDQSFHILFSQSSLNCLERSFLTQGFPSAQENILPDGFPNQFASRPSFLARNRIEV